MAIVKFVSIDKNARLVTFDVDGVEVERRVPENFAGTIDDYITALARGLAVEYRSVSAKAIDDPTFQADEIIVE